MVSLKFGQIWRHYKGGEYCIVGIGIDTETGNAYAVYRPVGVRTEIYLRPLHVFYGKTHDHKDRFTFVSDS